MKEHPPLFIWQSLTWRQTVWMSIAISAALLLILVPAFDLAAKGHILHWHVLQPGFIQGGLELIALYLALVMLLQRTGKLFSIFIPGLLCFLYLRRHHVDVPALVGLVYLEMLLALGALLCRLCKTSVDVFRDAPRHFVAGVAFWLALLLVSSLLGFGTAKNLLLIFALSAAPIFMLGRVKPLSLEVTQRILRAAPATRALSLLFVVWGLGLLARSNNVIGYDQMWYSFRSPYVLAPEHSLFDETGLVFPVFYFPKLFELLLLPLAAIPDFSFFIAVNIGVLGITILILYGFLQELGVSRNLTLTGCLVTASLPAIANLALSPKPDVIAGTFALFAAWWGWRFLQRGYTDDALIGLGATGLAVSSKLVALPYVGVLGIAILAGTLWRKFKQDNNWTVQAPTALGWVVLMLCTGVCFILTYRTWLLTGLPTIGPDPLLRVWEILGFKIRPPTGSLQWTWPQEWSQVPSLIRDMLFTPSSLPHMIITWIGNVWLWLGLLVVCMALVERKRIRAPSMLASILGPIVLTGVMLALGIRYGERGGDGNYLIIPLLTGMVWMVALTARVIGERPHAIRFVIGGLLAFSAMHVGYGFANASWGDPGTRPLDLDFSRTPLDTKRLRTQMLREAGLDEIATLLVSMPGHPRIVGYTRDDAGYWLPARYEALNSIIWSRPDYVSSKAGFFQLLEEARIDWIIWPRQGADRPPGYQPSVEEAITTLRGHPLVKIKTFHRYEVFDVSAL